VIDFYLHGIDESTLLERARAGTEEARKNQVCEADTYSGELSLADGDIAKARRHLNRARQECPVSFLEKLLAKRELLRM
jgi:lipoprotein NlpI